MIGGSGSPLGYPAIRVGSFDGSPLPTHHFLDPDRGEGCRSHICVVSELKNRDNGKDQRARPELLVSIEASVGRAPLDWMLGAQ